MTAAETNEILGRISAEGVNAAFWAKAFSAALETPPAKFQTFDPFLVPWQAGACLLPRGVDVVEAFISEATMVLNSPRTSSSKERATKLALQLVREHRMVPGVESLLS